MAHRSQCSDAGDNPLDPNYLPPHYREEYRLAIDALVEEDLEGYYTLLQKADVVDFLSSSEIDYIQSSVQLPEQSNQPALRSLEAGGDGSSDTYWPVHSDLDAPDLDLGWPQVHNFIGPTEVTTLVNPPEPDMPSIKEQARRLIKNAQQVIAIVMDTFTDVDIFADILNAAMRNVAVYILLDKENAHHFNNMVSNCRVDLQSMQFLRVRTVSGITYNCRSGKSLKGQMMDRFLLTDCRAVLSGNYSFMWSFEKLHRCMAHLFLGQLVSTFDEEFRILFALSQPIMFENVLAPMDNVSLLQKRQFPSDKTLMYREPRKFISLDTVHPDEWARHSYDERMDTESRMKPLRRNDSFHSPADLYSRYPSQQSYMDNPASKRHSYAEGVQGRYSFPFLQQQGIPEPEIQGRQFQRGQQPYPGPGKETDYSGYDKFWNQDFHSADQYSDPGLPPDRDPSGNYDPVLNYLSSTRNVDFDPDSENVPHVADLPFTSSHPQRLSLGQPYSCQTSPTPSNHSDQKQFFLEPNTDRKDPVVKRGLRNWRISSYLSANDNPGDEGLPLAPSNAPDAFEDTFKPMQQKGVGIDLPVPKIHNVREFKIPLIPRASQMPSYTKTTAREVPKRLPDELTAVAAETRITPSPSESSSTTEGEKTEESEPKEPKTAVLQREDSFRRKYNVAIPRSSRLRSSLIFSSLDQDNKTASGQQDEESDKSDAPKTKQPFVSQVLGQRRSKREPIEWSSFIKSATFDESATNPSKQLDEKNEADLKGLPEGLPENPVIQESFKPIDRESEPSAADLPKTDQTLFVDMSDPDNRLMIFKELAAKRKAAKAAEAEKNKAKAQMKPQTKLIDNTTVKKEGPAPEETLDKLADTPTSEGFSEKRAIAEDAGKEVFTEPGKSVSQSSDASDKTNNEDSQVKHYCDKLQSCKEKQTRVSTDSEKMGSLTPGSVEIPQSSSFAALDSSSRNPESSQLEQCIPSPLLLSASDSLHSPAVTSEVSISTPASSSMLSPNAQETLSLSAPEPSQSLEETLQKSMTSSIGQTESDQLHSVSQLTLSESRLTVDSAHVKSDITPDTCAANLEPNISSLHSSTITDSEESCAFTTSGICKTEVLGQSKGVKANTTPTKVSALWPESCLPQVSDLKSKSRSDQNETITLDTSDENSPAETSSPLHPDLAPNPPGSETTASPQDTPTQVTTPSELDLTGPVTPTLAETVSCSSPLTESVGLVLSPEAEKTLSALHSPSDTNVLPMQVITDSNETPKLSLTGTSTTNEPTSKVPIEPDLPCRTPKLVISETHPAELPVPAEMIGIDSQNEVSKKPEMPDCGEKAMDDMEATHNVNDTTTQESVCSEKTNDQVGHKDCSELPEIISDEVVPPSPQSKLPKSGQSRYQSSTANVISSSNLRDDTKLLLEQISANSQIRNEAAKESPVTDDEKEDEADKHAIREKERGIKSLSRGKPKSNPEREKLLERIQTMRKDRKVYSRFEMAP